MRICDMSTATMRLTMSAKILRERWEATREFWNDANAEQFEREVMMTLVPQLTLTLAAVHRMTQLLEQVERDCWDEEQL